MIILSKAIMRITANCIMSIELVEDVGAVSIIMAADNLLDP